MFSNTLFHSSPHKLRNNDHDDNNNDNNVNDDNDNNHFYHYDKSNDRKIGAKIPSRQDRVQLGPRSLATAENHSCIANLRHVIILSSDMFSRACV